MSPQIEKNKAHIFTRYDCEIFNSYLFASLLLILAVEANTETTVVHAYNGALDQLPESFVLDKEGNIYVSLYPIRQIQKISPDGSVSLLADFSEEAGTGHTVGVTIDKNGNVLVALMSNVSKHGVSYNGVWSISKKGKKKLLVSMPDAGFINDLVLDKKGNIFITDSFKGIVWKASCLYDKVKLIKWIENDLLKPDTSVGTLGANGLVFDPGYKTLYVSNTTKQTLVVIPVKCHGKAGNPELYVNLPGPPDGITSDRHGSIFVSLHNNQIVSVYHKSIEIIASNDGLDFPSSVKFGKRHCEKGLYISNFALEDLANPAILKLSGVLPLF